jgi:hypothetical protein
MRGKRVQKTVLRCDRKMGHDFQLYFCDEGNKALEGRAAKRWTSHLEPPTSLLVGVKAFRSFKELSSGGKMR